MAKTYAIAHTPFTITPFARVTMKNIMAVLITASILSGCCEMAYGPSQCPMAAAPQQSDLVASPQQLAAPMMQQPQDLVPSALTPPLPPEQATPIIVKAPFMMGPSIDMSPPETNSEPQTKPAKAAQKSGSNQKPKPANENTAEANWLHP